MLREAVEQAAVRTEVREAIARVYADLQTEIDRRRPKCEMSGRCCRFDEYGHRLYVTTMELAAFLPPPARGEGTSGCPFQLDGVCTVHAIRPFGCRVFFCDETATDWQHEQYERFHSQIKRLHEQFDVPYVYIEWRAALRELGLSTLPATGKPADDRGPLSLPQLRL
jgi:Fe-S-cluster containining protein